MKLTATHKVVIGIVTAIVLYIIMVWIYTMYWKKEDESQGSGGSESGKNTEHFSTFLRDESVRSDDDVYCANESPYF